MFVALRVYAHCGNDVVLGHDDAIDINGHEIGFTQIATHQLRPGLSTLFDELARHGALGDAQLIGAAVNPRERICGC